MTKAIFGAVAGLVLGTVGALAYSQYVEDNRLADLQAQLDAANAKLTKDAQVGKSMSQETSSVSDQIDHLQATNDDLRKQIEDLKSGAPTSATASAGVTVNPLTLAGIMRGMMRGGGQGQNRMLLLQTRLHLTPDQTAKIKAAMDADNRARGEAMRAMFRNGGKPDPNAAPPANTLDQTLTATLSPSQQMEYKKVQADEQTSRAETSATIQMDQMAPLLQLSDAQKDQVSSALYQLQMSQPDPTSLITNPDAMSVLASQAKNTEAVMAKVLTPDQMGVYQQAGQAFSQVGFGGGGFGGRNRGNGGGGGGNGGNAVPAPAAAATAAMPAVASPAVATPAATDSAATNAPTATDASSTNAAPATSDSSSTNAAAASTNAAPSQ